MDNAVFDHDGLRLMAIEMTRQCKDALTTLDQSAQTASSIADAIRENGRLVLYGIGGSHYVNRIVEPIYRRHGADCRAMSASEALMSPLPPAHRVALFVSQSGESGEIVDLLKTDAGLDRRFALTLNASSTLGTSVEAAIVATGGPENAFAATRSIILTLAMHAAILAALGTSLEALRDVLRIDSPCDLSSVGAIMSKCDAIVFAGRDVMQGVAQSAALSLMELARVTAIGLESGQFRHGPFEFLRPGIGVVLLRSAGADKNSIASIAATCIDAGCTTIVLDASGDALDCECTQVQFPMRDGLAAAAQFLLSLQHFNIVVAKRNIAEAIGTPRFTSKVTI